jgi:hypothetical protein
VLIFQNDSEVRSGKKFGAQTSAKLKQVLVCLQEFNLLREAMPPVMSVPFKRGMQPVVFAFS